MPRTLSRMYDSYGQAQRVVAKLQEAGFTEVSLVSRHRDDETLVEDNKSGSGAAAGATAGAVVGGGTGILTALGIIAIPGLGPLVAAGALATTLAGVATGGVVGGLLGALTGAGVSEEDAHVYSEGVRRGSTVVTVRTEDTGAAMADAIMNAEQPVDTAETGWSQYDPSSKGMTAEEVRRERERYHTSRG